MSALHRQRGVALLAAIVLVAIGTIVAASLAFQSAMAARRGIASFSFEQSVLVAQGAEAIAARVLKDDADGENAQSTDDLTESWATPLPPTEVVPGVMLEASIEDLQGRFNLNSLVLNTGEIDPEALDALRRLLEALQIEPDWADRMADWIDPDTDPSGFNGLEDGTTTGQTPPYRTANTIITSSSELLALPGFGRDRYLKLAPYVTALPPGTSLNVCTAPGIVLDAMIGRGFSQFKDPETLVKNRESGCFPTREQYLQILHNDGESQEIRQGGLDRFISGKSKYFRLTSIVTLGGTDFALYSLLRRDESNVRVAQRGFNPD